jgi:DNA polymerase-3 subunit gamma/tau
VVVEAVPPAPLAGTPRSAAPATATPAALADPAPEERGSPALEPAAEAELTLERLVALWPAVLEAVRVGNKMLGAVIADAVPVELTDRRLVLAFPEDSAFLRRKADDQPNRQAVADAVRAVTGRTLRLAYDLRELSDQEAPAPLTEEEWVARLKAEFDAEELVTDRPTDPAPQEEPD